MIKITDNQIQDEGCQPGEKNWTTKHLPSDAAKAFEDQVVPMMRMKTGLLPPWESPMMRDLQATIDKVYWAMVGFGMLYYLPTCFHSTHCISS